MIRLEILLWSTVCHMDTPPQKQLNGLSLSSLKQTQQNLSCSTSSRQRYLRMTTHIRLLWLAVCITSRNTADIELSEFLRNELKKTSRLVTRERMIERGQLLRQVTHMNSRAELKRASMKSDATITRSLKLRSMSRSVRSAPSP